MSLNQRVDAATTQLLKELSDAKTWPERFKPKIDSGANVSDEIAHADKKIEELEKRAREAMKRLGCDCSDTRTIFQTMADMLINWHTFKDTLP